MLLKITRGSISYAISKNKNNFKVTKITFKIRALY